MPENPSMRLVHAGSVLPCFRPPQPNGEGGADKEQPRDQPERRARSRQHPATFELRAFRQQHRADADQQAKDPAQEVQDAIALGMRAEQDQDCGNDRHGLMATAIAATKTSPNTFATRWLL